MKKRFMQMGLCTLAALSLVGAVFAEVIERDGVSKEETIDCRGRVFKLSGTSNNITLLGECPELWINGTDNTVRVERVGTIHINGVDNKVFWSESMIGRIPENITEGVDNKITQERMEGTPPPRHKKRHEPARAAESENYEPAEEPAPPRESAVNVQAGPRGGSVRVKSATGAVRVEGGPRGGAVRVEGERGAVMVKGGPRGGVVAVEGAHGSVRVESGARGRSVSVNVGGSAPEETEAEVAPPVQPEEEGDITVSGNSLSRVITCHGENVSVIGNDNHVQVNGECGEVSVNGAGNVVKLQAVGVISVIGSSNQVNWEHSLGGGKPRITKNGSGNKITQTPTQSNSRTR